LSHQFPDAVVTGLVVDTVVTVVLIVVEVVFVVDVEDGVIIDVGVEVLVVHDAKTSDTTMEHVKIIHVTPFFIRPSC
jgi:hypothetical protein